MSISGVLIQSFVILFVVCAGSEKKTLCVEILFVVLIPFLSVYLFISFSLKIFFFSPQTVWRGFGNGLLVSLIRRCDLERLHGFL